VSRKFFTVSVDAGDPKGKALILSVPGWYGCDFDVYRLVGYQAEAFHDSIVRYSKAHYPGPWAPDPTTRSLIEDQLVRIGVFLSSSEARGLEYEGWLRAKEVMEDLLKEVDRLEKISPLLPAVPKGSHQ
jgi:hypothetical protein